MKSSLKPYLQPAFVICLTVLLTAAATKTTLIKTLGVQLTKLPIPLKKPLDQMDATRLEPYLVLKKNTIKDRDVIESLGTEEYLQWMLEDSQADKNSPVRFCSLFITYYTGNPDMVPHVPDECYVGGGNIRQSAEILKVAVPSAAGGPDSELSFQYVIFSRTDRDSFGAETKFSVQYLFKANGQYSDSRTQTRRILGKNFFGKYSYFAKVEWNFYGEDGFSGKIFPNKEQTIEASGRLLAQLIPILEEDHWPDWQQADKQK